MLIFNNSYVSTPATDYLFYMRNQARGMILFDAWCFYEVSQYIPCALLVFY